MNTMVMDEKAEMEKLLEKPFVSVVCPTADRRKFIPQMLRYFREQDYTGRMELVILDSGDDAIGDMLKDQPASEFRQIRYERTEKRPIGSLRNQLNELASGDIIVCFDDDDYYPPERVSHAVAQLEAYPDKMIAGVSSQVIYFPDMRCLMQTAAKHPYHATAGTFAYRKEYLKYHRYDELAARGEEKSFTNGFTVPLIQLDHRKTILVISHGNNTITKKELISYSTPLYFRPIETILDDPQACEFYDSLKGEDNAKRLLI
jgi:glycosyltransferase involved in cell wall biosynthesis